MRSLSKAAVAVVLFTGALIAPGLWGRTPRATFAPRAPAPPERPPAASELLFHTFRPASHLVETTTPPPPPAKPAALAAVIPPCQLPGLHVSELGAKVALGTALMTYLVQRSATSACSLAGGSWAQALAGQEMVRSVTILSRIGAAVPPASSVLTSRAPGAVVELNLDTLTAGTGAAAAKAAAPAARLVPRVPPLAKATLPSVPKVPAAPSVPKVPAAPSLPKVPAAPSLPSVPKVPAAPTVTVPPAVSSTESRVVATVFPPRPSPAPKPAPAPAPAPSPSPSPSHGGPTSYPSGSTGYDISWPQCGSSYPPAPYTVSVVGVNDGRAFTDNPCLSSESQWAGANRQVYLNINSPNGVNSHDSSGPAGNCTAGASSCLAYNYGYNSAVQGLAYTVQLGDSAEMVWLDVEMAGQCSSAFPTGGQGYWSCSQALNSMTIQGAIDAIRKEGYVAGVYSTGYQWGVITGGYQPSGGQIADWVAGAQNDQSWCSSSHGFASGYTSLLQLYPSNPYDRDRAC